MLHEFPVKRFSCALFVFSACSTPGTDLLIAFQNVSLNMGIQSFDCPSSRDVTQVDLASKKHSNYSHIRCDIFYKDIDFSYVCERDKNIYVGENLKADIHMGLITSIMSWHLDVRRHQILRLGLGTAISNENMIAYRPATVLLRRMWYLLQW